MNKKLLQVVIAFGLIFSISGCTKNDTTQQKNAKKVKVTVDKHGKPLWVSNPNMDGQTGVVSIVSTKKIKKKKKLIYIAKMKAKAAFQTRKGTSVDSSSKTKMDNSGKMSYSEKTKISSTHIETTKLVVRQTYQDKENFYMWMVVDK